MEAATDVGFLDERFRRGRWCRLRDARALRGGGVLGGGGRGGGGRVVARHGLGAGVVDERAEARDERT